MFSMLMSINRLDIRAGFVILLPKPFPAVNFASVSRDKMRNASFSVLAYDDSELSHEKLQYYSSA